MDQGTRAGESPGACPIAVLGVVPAKGVGVLVEIFSHQIHALAADDVRHLRPAVYRGYKQGQFRRGGNPCAGARKTGHVVAAVAPGDLPAAVVELVRRLIVVLDVVAHLVGVLVLVVVAGDPEIDAAGRLQHIFLHEGLVVHAADLLDHHRKGEVAEVRIFLRRPRDKLQPSPELKLHQALLCRYFAPAVLHHYPAGREHRVAAFP